MVRQPDSFITIEENSGERTIVWDRDDRLAYTSPKKLRVTWITRSGLTSDARSTACVRVAQDAKQAGTLISADIDNVYDGLPSLLPIDILLGSKEFPHRVTGIVDPMGALVELQEPLRLRDRRQTLGDQGAVIYCEGQFLKSPRTQLPADAKTRPGLVTRFARGSFTECSLVKTLKQA
jgi:hypothetical protein